MQAFAFTSTLRENGSFNHKVPVLMHPSHNKTVVKSSGSQTHKSLIRIPKVGHNRVTF